MTSGVAGWTRESLSSQRFSNIGGDALSRSVRDGAVEASMPPIVPRLRAVQWSVRGRGHVLVEDRVRALAAPAFAELVERAGLIDRRLVVLVDLAAFLIAHGRSLPAQRWSDFTPRNSSSARYPSSRPWPHCLTPPNGASGLKAPPLISTWP